MDANGAVYLYIKLQNSRGLASPRLCSLLYKLSKVHPERDTPELGATTETSVRALLH